MASPCSPILSLRLQTLKKILSFARLNYNQSIENLNMLMKEYLNKRPLIEATLMKEGKERVLVS
jgi:hypothetical protein